MSRICGVICAVLLLVSCNGAAIKEASEHFEKLLGSKEMFKLRDELAGKQADRLQPEMRLYYQAQVYNAFNQNQAAVELVGKLLKSYRPQLTDSIIMETLGVQADSYLKLYRYGDAAATYSDMLEHYRSYMKNEEAEDLKNMISLLSALKNVPPQELIRNEDVTLPCDPNDFNSYILAVTSNGVSEEFVFDTGANFSTISMSNAKRMGFQIIDASIDVATGTSIVVQSHLAVADSLYVGGLLFKNVVFLVLPDEHLYFEEVDYRIHGILGFPVMNQMGEIIISREGFLTVPLNPEKNKPSNIFLDGLSPVIATQVGSDTLLLKLDTGAQVSELSFKYFKQYEKQVKEQGVEKVEHTGGAGGVVARNVFVVPNFEFRVGGSSIALDNISVSTEELKFTKYYYGNLGQDVLLQRDKMVINFECMFLELID